MPYLTAASVPPSPTSTSWHWVPGQFAPIPAYLIVCFAALLGIILSRRLAAVRSPAPVMAMAGGFDQGGYDDTGSAGVGGKRGLITDIIELLLVAAAVSTIAAIPLIHALGTWTSHIIGTITQGMGTTNATVTEAAVATVLVIALGWWYHRTENDWITLAFALVVLVFASLQPVVGTVLRWVIQNILSFIWYAVFWLINRLGDFTLGVRGVTSSPVATTWNWTPGIFPPVPSYLIVTLAALLGIMLVRRLTTGKGGRTPLIGDLVELILAAAAVSSLADVNLVKAIGLWFAHLLEAITGHLGAVGSMTTIVIVAIIAVLLLGRWYTRTERNTRENLVAFVFAFVALIVVTAVPIVHTWLNWVIQNPLSLIWYALFWFIAWVGHFTLGVKGV